MDPSFIELLQRLRDTAVALQLAKSFVINSGCRCQAYNAKVGGKPDSLHLVGKAADIYLEIPEDGPEIAKLAEDLGFGGIGLAKIYIHVDTGPAGRRWTYP